MKVVAKEVAAQEVATREVTIKKVVTKKMMNELWNLFMCCGTYLCNMLFLCRNTGQTSTTYPSDTGTSSTTMLYISCRKY